MTDRAEKTAHATAGGAAPEPAPLTADGHGALDGVGGTGPGSSGGTDGATGTGAKTGADTEAAPTLHPTPGDLGDLAPEQLALTSQWTALAALAHHGDANGWGLQALRQLIRSAGRPVAFTWMWAVLQAGTSPQAWGELSNLPRPLRIPEPLVDDVAREIATPTKATTHRSQARLHLLRALDPDDPASAGIAWAVLTQKAPRYDDQSAEAVRLLGASRNPATRADVLAFATAAGRAGSAHVRRRVELVAALQPPLSPQEQAASVQAAHALTEDQPLEPTWALANAPWAWPALRALAPRLTAKDLLALCSQTWITGSSGPAIAAELFATLLETLPGDVRTSLVEQATALPPPVRSALLARLAMLPAAVGLPLVDLAHQVLPSADLGPLHTGLQRLLKLADAAGDTRQRDRALTSLQHAALAVPRWQPRAVAGDPVADLRDSSALVAWTSAMHGGEISRVVRSELDHAQLRRLGAAGALLLARAAFGAAGPSTYPPSQAEGEALGIVQQLDDDACDAVLSGLVPLASGLLPDSVRRHALSTGPRSTATVAQADPAATAALLFGVLEEGLAPLPIQRALDVLETVPAGTTVQVVHDLAAGLDWVRLEDSGLLAQAAAALARHPHPFQQALRGAVGSLNGPAAAQASTARITALVTTAVATPSLAADGQETAALVAVLVDCARRDLHDLAAAWLSTAVPTQPVVEVTARASNDSAQQPNRYTPARTQQAAELCRQAGDQERPAEQRLRALQLAVIADPDQAHAAAMGVIDGSPRSLRRGAAQVLVDTPRAVHDGAALERLITGEEDAETLRLLETARRHITSDSTDQALADLLDFLDVDRATLPTTTPETAVCLPEQRWHEPFRESVNQVRASVRDTPRNRINNLITLGEAIGEQAILALWRQQDTTRSRPRAAELFAHSSKESIGNLVHEKQLLDEMPWLSDLASLRRRRSVHASQRNPDALSVSTEAHVVTAVDLTCSLVQGWVQSMYVLAARRSSGPGA